MIKENTRKILNILIVALTIIGTIVMFQNRASATGLTASGFRNLKFFTVLSNELAGLTALAQLIFDIRKTKTVKPLFYLKLMSAAATGITFLVVIGFLGPLYGHSNMYQGSNLYFHLLVPLLCMAEFMLYDHDGLLTFKSTLTAMLPPIVYGLAYIINILINGIVVWPESNDWYGFLNWGPVVGAVIFIAVILFTWGLSLLLSLCNRLAGKRTRPAG